MLTSKTVQQFVDETASNSPAPGGGSVSALAAALGVALTSMVCRLTTGKKKYASVEQEMEQVLKESENLRSRCLSAVDEDTNAFNKVMEALRLPKDSEQEKSARQSAIQQATREATLIPLKLMELCLEGMKLAHRVAEKGNVNSISDAGVSALMLQAACAGAELNVRINLKSIEEKGFVEEVSRKTKAISESISSSGDQIRTIVDKALS